MRMRGFSAHYIYLSYIVEMKKVWIYTTFFIRDYETESYLNNITVTSHVVKKKQAFILFFICCLTAKNKKKKTFPIIIIFFISPRYN